MIQHASNISPSWHRYRQLESRAAICSLCARQRDIRSMHRNLLHDIAKQIKSFLGRYPREILENTQLKGCRSGDPGNHCAGNGQPKTSFMPDQIARLNLNFSPRISMGLAIDRINARSAADDCLTVQISRWSKLEARGTVSSRSLFGIRYSGML
ncbi:uncharacterized protein LY89DRAFT_251586 [Mollisia scopiformis]|uniref:Uncharacterized protein n=1 Tax=Mollisia scopiformis TaxID=149040 RepID=A0A194WSB9_MOLSC|nr:uncharacterized protein LY89DRAFT_251586 [Mollisia scopiformis]KUJ10861.1 hypothetical protein LY89DRAFT_251586 [Mollisia scopiformis]